MTCLALSIFVGFLSTFRYELGFNLMGNEVYKGGIKARTEGEFVSEFSQVLTISVN